jgi:hypothetical protein
MRNLRGTSLDLLEHRLAFVGCLWTVPHTSRARLWKFFDRVLSITPFSEQLLRFLSRVPSKPSIETRDGNRHI